MKTVFPGREKRYAMAALCAGLTLGLGCCAFAGQDFNVIARSDVVGHADNVLAYTGGYYEKEGLDVNFTANPSNPEAVQSILAGKQDLGSSSIGSVLQYIDEGADELVIIGGQMSSGETLYALPERAEEFAELNEETLAGKKIGVTRMNTGDIVFRKILHDRGVDLSKIEFVELDSQATVTTSVLNGSVDLGINFLTFREPAEAQGLVPISHFDAEDEWPDFTCCRLFTTKESLAKNRDAYVKAVKANIEAYEEIVTDHDKALADLKKGIELDEETLRNQVYDYGHLGLSPNVDVKNTSKFYDAMVEIGYSKGSDISDNIDPSVFIDALDELLEEDPDNEVYLELKKVSEETNY